MAQPEILQERPKVFRLKVPTQEELEARGFKATRAHLAVAAFVADELAVRHALVRDRSKLVPVSRGLAAAAQRIVLSLLEVAFFDSATAAGHELAQQLVDVGLSAGQSLLPWQRALVDLFHALPLVLRRHPRLTEGARADRHVDDLLNALAERIPSSAIPLILREPSTAQRKRAAAELMLRGDIVIPGADRIPRDDVPPEQWKLRERAGPGQRTPYRAARDFAEVFGLKLPRSEAIAKRPRSAARPRGNTSQKS